MLIFHVGKLNGKIYDNDDDDDEKVELEEEEKGKK